MEAEMKPTAPAGPDSTSSGRTSLAFGLLLLAADQLRAILDAAREELRSSMEGQATAGDHGRPGEHGRPGGVRQPLVGLALEVQRQALAAGTRFGRGWVRGSGRTVAWAWQFPPLAGVRSRVEAEAARLARSGAAREAQARRLAAVAVATAVHRVTSGLLDQEFEQAYQRAIARLMETPEIAELVREQSAGIAQELATSVRARAATGDDVVERLVSRILRRPSAAGVGAPEVPEVPGVPEVPAATQVLGAPQVSGTPGAAGPLPPAPADGVEA